MNSLKKASQSLTVPKNLHRRSLSVTPVSNKIVPTNDTPRDDQLAEEQHFLKYPPVVGSKYIDVWQRARLKLRAQRVMQLLITGDKHIPRFSTQTNPSLEIALPEDLEGTMMMANLAHKFENGMTESATNDSLPWHVLHPTNKVKNIWNIILAVLLVYTVTVMPFSMAFITSVPGDPWDMTDYVTDVMFFIDFLINCVSAYYDKTENLIIDHKQIFCNYAKSWMLVDIICFFPFTLLDTNTQQQSYSSSNKYNNLVRLLRLPKLYRLFRISRLLKLLKHYHNIELIEKIQECFSIKNSVMRLIKSFVTIILCLHLAACMWYFSARLDGFSPDTWVVRFQYQDQDMGSLYLISIYWAFTTLCTVGYGDIYAFTNLEKIICICWMICGLYFFSFTIGSLSSMMSSIDTKENVLLGKLAVIDEFSVEANLNKDLRNKLKHALRYSAEKRGFSWLDKLSIFNELPKTLRYEVAINMHHGAAKDITFFKGKDQTIIAAIVPLLQPMFLERNDYVYKKGEFADEIYFIVRGRISYVFGKEDTVLKSMQRGSYFGDIEVVKGISRKYHAKGVRSSELLIMHKQVVQQMIEEHSAVWEEIRKVALEREKLNEKAIIEIQELIRLRNNDELEGINVKDFKKNVDKLFEKRCQHIHDKHQIYSLKDLACRIDTLSKVLRAEEDSPDVVKLNLMDEDLDL